MKVFPCDTRYNSQGEERIDRLRESKRKGWGTVQLSETNPPRKKLEPSNNNKHSNGFFKLKKKHKRKKLKMKPIS
jgi:hypothetical protein